MGYNPPGLTERPDDRALAGFASLMPTPLDKPGVLRRVIKAPLVVIGLPFRLARGALGLPRRVLCRSRGGNGAD